jgi:predicted PurR-regulated permease PerM
LTQTRKVFVYLLLITVIGACSIFLWFVRGSLYPFVLASVMAYLLHPFTRAVQAKGVNRFWAILSVYIIASGVLLLFCLLIVPLIIADMQQLSQILPAIVANSQELIDQMGQHYHSISLPAAVRQQVDAALFTAQNDVTAVITDLANGAVKLVRYSLGILISPILAFYLLYDWDKIKDHFVLLVPKSGRRQVTTLIKDLDDVLAGVVRGQLLVAAIVGTCVTGGLYFLQVPFAILIGFIAGVLDIIPYFGAIIGAAPAVTLSLLQSPALAMKVGLLFLVIHQLEGMIIGPKILGDTIGLHPLIIIFCLFAGGELFGVTGMLLAVPVAAVFKVCWRHFIEAIV